MRRLSIGLCAVALLVAACGAESNQSAQQTSNGVRLRTVRDIPLQGNTSRFDYQSFDAQSHRLYIGDGTATVYDTSSGAVVGEIKDVPGVHGVIAVPELGKIYATATWRGWTGGSATGPATGPATGKNQLAAIDPNSLAIIATTEGGAYPDGLAYDPEVGKVYVSDEHGGTDTVVDTRSNQAIGKIQVGDDVGNTQFDPGSHRMLVAVGSKNQLVAVDPASDTVVGATDLAGCQGAHGLGIDSDARRAFVACEGNAKFLTLDLQSMQVVFTGEVGKTPDVLDLDRSLRRVYVAAEGGPLTVFDYSGGVVRQLVQADAGPNAHSVAVDSTTHHIYLPLQNVNGHPVLREMVVEP